MEKIISLISEKENLILLLSCTVSIAGAIMALISVRLTIRDQRILKRRLRKKYIQQYKNRHSSFTESELDKKLRILLTEIDANIVKIKKNQEITYSKEQIIHLQNVIQAVEKIKISSSPLEQPSQVGKLRYLEKLTKDIVTH